MSGSVPPPGVGVGFPPATSSRGLWVGVGVALAGAQLPANVMPGDEHNAKGYFEPWKIAIFNDERLRAAGSAWDDPFAYPFRPLPAEQEAGWIRRGLELFDEEFGASAWPLMKDPRATVLLPFWRKMLAARNVAARCVVPVRHPLAVAGSLRRRDGFTDEKSVLVWSAYMLAAAEIEFWALPDFSRNTFGGMPEVLRSAEERFLDVYRSQLRPFEAEYEVAPGVVVCRTGGHTPGHSVVRLASGGDRLMFAGDLVFQVGFEHPDWYNGFEHDPEEAARVRVRLLRELAANRESLVATHLSFPSVCHVAVAGDAFRWVPGPWEY